MIGGIPLDADRMGTLRRILLVLVVLASRVAADDTDRVQGFLAPSAGEVSGRVTDGNGAPLKNATVHIVTKRGTRTVTTDGNGTYKTNVDDRSTLVVVYGDANISGAAVTTQTIDGLEAIQVKDAIPPAVFAKPHSDPTFIPEYTDEMMDTNAWTRAWLLLEISETGVVSRVKLLNRPGFGLDAIAIRDAFKLTFDPARNRVDKPVRSQMLWKYEWPAFWWMKEHGYARRRMPGEAMRVPCRGSGPANKVYRDCSRPNMSAALTARWIDRPR